MIVSNTKSIADEQETFSGILIGLNTVCIYQLLYIIPLFFLLKQQQRFGLMKGIIIGAIITALLNGMCFLILLSS